MTVTVAPRSLKFPHELVHRQDQEKGSSALSQTVRFAGLTRDRGLKY
jgi:hypothetical protein